MGSPSKATKRVTGSPLSLLAGPFGALGYVANKTGQVDKLNKKLFGGEPKIPGIKPPPVLPDATDAMIKGLNRDALQRQLRASRGRSAAFSFGGARSSSSLLGG